MRNNILVIGGGGREHALSWKLAQSPEAGQVFCSPGNGGTANSISLPTCEDVLEFCRTQAIGLVVIGPEQPLVDGWTDRLRAANIPVFGPSRAAARLEESKAFTKELCRTYNIPTAAYAVFTQSPPAKAYLRTQAYPLVVKADGLAAGKGVIIAQTQQEAEDAVDSMFSGAFGAAGNQVVIEEFLQGEEVSFFALCDGNTALEFGHAQDHKRAFDGDQGPNTGGMGAYAPAPVMTQSLRAQVMAEIIHPTLAAMRQEGTPFQGMLFAGLMLTAQGPKLLEYNTRFGDPETQVLMRRLDTDLYPLLAASASGNLKGHEIRMRNESAICVVMAAKGYPGAYAKHTRIQGLDAASRTPEVVIFHAGTENKNGEILAAGGRVLGVTALGATLAEARTRAYAAIDNIQWPEGFCRRDIGWRALSHKPQATRTSH